MAPMKWHELSEQHCSVARSLAVVGDRWTLLILRDLFLGARRFETIRDSLGLSRTILAERLSLLEAEGVLRRKPYQEKPLRHEYHLTGKGIDLYPVIMFLLRWGDRYYAGDQGPPVVQHHLACGHDFTPELHCSECGEPVSPFETRPRAGEGFPQLAALLSPDD